MPASPSLNLAKSVSYFVLSALSFTPPGIAANRRAISLGIVVATIGRSLECSPVSKLRRCGARIGAAASLRMIVFSVGQTNEISRIEGMVIR